MAPRTVVLDEERQEWRCDLGDGTVVIAKTLSEMEDSLDVADEYIRTHRKESHEYLRH